MMLYNDPVFLSGSGGGNGGRCGGSGLTSIDGYDSEKASVCQMKLSQRAAGGYVKRNIVKYVRVAKFKSNHDILN